MMPNSTERAGKEAVLLVGGLILKSGHQAMEKGKVVRQMAE
jgi:hypothetical protein